MSAPEVTVQDEAAFLALMFELGEIGAAEGGGIYRLAASPADARARAVLCRELSRLGAAIAVDAVGNQFGRLFFGTERGSILCGSHLDSQPMGGRYDGALGVAAGVIAARVLARNADLACYRRDLVLCNWTNEEGARFTPSLTGSSVFAGAMTIETALSLQDAEGVGLGQALKAVGYLGSDTAPRDALAFVELHVEQGPVLEQCGAQIGLVERAWAARKMRLRFLGEPAHTGPTAKNKRRDALRAAASFIAAAHDIADAAPGEPILSIARIENAPNSSNVIACETRLWIEIRHPLEEVCQAIGQQLLTLVEDSRILGGCKFEVEQDLLRQSISLDKAGRQLAMEACLAQGVSWRVLPTVAGHDALALARVMPTTLLFVPSQAGISHSPKEFTRPEAMLTGLRLLVEWLHRRLRDETLP